MKHRDVADGDSYRKRKKNAHKKEDRSDLEIVRDNRDAAAEVIEIHGSSSEEGEVTSECADDSQRAKKKHSHRHKKHKKRRENAEVNESEEFDEVKHRKHLKKEYLELKNRLEEVKIKKEVSEPVYKDRKLKEDRGKSPKRSCSASSSGHKAVHRESHSRYITANAEDHRPRSRSNERDLAYREPDRNNWRERRKPERRDSPKRRYPDDRNGSGSRHEPLERRGIDDRERRRSRSPVAVKKEASRSPRRRNGRASEEARGGRERGDRVKRERSPVAIKRERSASPVGRARQGPGQSRRREEDNRDGRMGRPGPSRRRNNDDDVDDSNMEWGQHRDRGNEGQPQVKEEPREKDKPDFKLSGKLTEDRNTCNGIVVKYSEPPEARMPKKRWRLYQFKGQEAMPTLYIHRQSAYLIGRDRKVADLPVDHPSCSKQHAALQYRLVTYERPNGSVGKRIRLYVIDLESANGTFINGNKIESKKYVELMEKDVIKFGFSSREYVLLHEQSKDDEESDD